MKQQAREPSAFLESLERYSILYSESLFPGGKPDRNIIWPEMLDAKFRASVKEINGRVNFFPPDDLDDTWMCILESKQ